MYVERRGGEGREVRCQASDASVVQADRARLASIIEA
jgi:hypothetical protein